MSKLSKEERREKVINVLNKARSMELQAIHQYMNQHYNLDDMDYFDNVQDHIDKLGDVYLSKIAGTPSSTGLQPQGFTMVRA
jgi:hypothetical protein